MLHGKRTPLFLTHHPRTTNITESEIILEYGRKKRAQTQNENVGCKVALALHYITQLEYIAEHCKTLIQRDSRTSEKNVH